MLMAFDAEMDIDIKKLSVCKYNYGFATLVLMCRWVVIID